MISNTSFVADSSEATQIECCVFFWSFYLTLTIETPMQGETIPFCKHSVRACARRKKPF